MFQSTNIKYNKLFLNEEKSKLKPERLSSISKYHAFKGESNVSDPKKECFHIDDITWNDLSMNDIFEKINLGLSSAGEQKLYHRLRTPYFDENDFHSFRNKVEVFKSDKMARENAMKELLKLNINTQAQVVDLFKKPKDPKVFLYLYLLLFFSMVGSLFGLLISKVFLLPIVILMCVNFTVHHFGIKAITYVHTVNYMAQVVAVTKKLEKRLPDSLSTEKQAIKSKLGDLKGILKFGGIYIAYGNGILDILCSWFLVDLISYYILCAFMKNKENELLSLFECLGDIESALSVASFEVRNQGHCSVPKFVKGSRTITLKKMNHPLVNECVLNDAYLTNSLLITGSNASGKSTYIKAVGLNILLAQTIGLTLCEQYQGDFCKLYTSMALRDDLSKNDSYYMAEIKSMNRIVKASQAGDFMVSIVDEILRGTNTTERIAASSKILETLNTRGVICITATHDIELCYLLNEKFEMFHFEEQVDDKAIHFDYRIKTGMATSRNAIKLLALIGFDAALIEAAEASASHYDKHRVWV